MSSRCEGEACDTSRCHLRAATTAWSVKNVPWAASPGKWPPRACGARFEASSALRYAASSLPDFCVGPGLASGESFLVSLVAKWGWLL